MLLVNHSQNQAWSVMKMTSILTGLKTVERRNGKYGDTGSGYEP